MVTLAETLTETSEVVMPDGTNNLGRALGGWVLHRMDICGVIAARRFSRGQVVTASIEQVDFHAPIDLGDIAVATGYVYDAGETSVQVRVDIEAERPSEGVTRQTASSRLTFVAIDEDGNTRGVPTLETPTDRERELRVRVLDDVSTGVQS